MSETQAGQPARKLGGGWEIIGPPDCPIMLRRTLAAGRLGKILWHRFMPGAADKDPHDHPRPFLTVVLRGGYNDVRADGKTDRVRAPALRYRSASHAHITEVGPRGATTLVLMGPLVRDWGFWRDGRWWPWRRYEERFGLGFRCDDDELDEEAEGAASTTPSSPDMPPSEERTPSDAWEPTSP